MFFKQPDLTAGSRPLLEPDETLLFVQNGVGLYEGEYKIADCQGGHAYLTSHRAYYIDDQDPRQNSLAFDLKDVDRYKHQAGFLRSSPKITIYPKPLRKAPGSIRHSAHLSQGVQRLQQSSSSPGSRSSSPLRTNSVSRAPPSANTASWICPICTFTNPVPSNFDPSIASESFPIPPCLTCGIKPPFALILKAAISGGTSRSAETPTTPPTPTTPLYTNATDPRRQSFSSEPSTLVCPRCTFHNHPSLQICEICGSPLPTTKQTNVLGDSQSTRSGSPAPIINHVSESEDPVAVKFSFRSGGDRVFHDRLKGAMVQRKWLASNAPPVPKPDSFRRSDPGSPVIPGSDSRASPRSSRVGIAGLEQLGKQSHKDNEFVIGSAFEDLESLMALDKEVSALAQKIAREFGDDANSTTFDSDLNAMEPGMIATRDMLGTSSEKIYISELARNLAEYVTDERRGLLRKKGGTMSLVDLWATFNRTRDGVELVSPDDFHKAATMWSNLGLPVRLKQFKSGLLAVQRLDMSDDRVVDQLRRWLESFRNGSVVITETTNWDWARYGSGVTAQDAAKKFGWSLGIANEELEMAEERGVLCREESVEGLKFWLNFFDEPDDTEI